MKCPKCGYSKDGAGATPGVGAGPAKMFNSDKHILIMNLTKFRDLLGENEELKGMIKPQSEFPMSDDQIYKKRSLFKFFWPFLLGGIDAGIVIYIISMAIMFSSAMDIATQPSVSDQQVQTFANHAMTNIYGGYIVAIAVALAIIFMGLWLSRKKRDAFNSNADMMNRIASERYQKGLQNERMIDIYQDNLANMRRYEDLVPAEYQTSQKVSLIIEALKEDKADTVEEAIALL
jgi:uncharacterized membrane protein